MQYQLCTIPVRIALLQNFKKYHASDLYPGAVPDGILAQPTLEVLIRILSGHLGFVKGKSF